jgi:hypothetical protein
LGDKEYKKSRFERGFRWIDVCSVGFALFLVRFDVQVVSRTLTLDEASAQADTMTPSVRMATEKICSGVYFFPRRYPAAIVVTLPKLLRMMWTGTDILNAKAQLFIILTVKNSAALIHHLRNGTGDDRMQ